MWETGGGVRRECKHNENAAETGKACFFTIAPYNPNIVFQDNMHYCVCDSVATSCIACMHTCICTSYTAIETGLHQVDFVGVIVGMTDP